MNFIVFCFEFQLDIKIKIKDYKSIFLIIYNLLFI
uniref:Uncharacterized protein n=1 Tax=Digenea simplex TaxID=945030 RepID=A0A1Z1MTZ7_DIGSM|nr:hypothetical protein [Digenea simplex]ARW69568.1 hypothetical protein [Digenea simplex]